MIKTTTARKAADSQPSRTEKRSTPTTKDKAPEVGRADKVTLSKETQEKKARKLPDLDASYGDKSTEKSKTKNQPEQKKIDKLKAQLKEAEKGGDTEAVERIKKELERLLNPAKPGKENGGTPSVKGSNPKAPRRSKSASKSGAGAASGKKSGAGTPSGKSPQGGPAGGKKAGGNSPAGGANEAGAGQEASSQEVRQFLQKAAAAYGVNPKLLSEIARRESNFNTGGITNNWDSNAKKGTPSKGMFQFIQPTFQAMMPKAKAANPQAWQGVSGNWTDWKAQALTCAWAISRGKGSHWSTYKKALASAGGNPRGTAAA